MNGSSQSTQTIHQPLPQGAPSDNRVWVGNTGYQFVNPTFSYAQQLTQEFLKQVEEGLKLQGEYVQQQGDEGKKFGRNRSQEALNQQIRAIKAHYAHLGKTYNLARDIQLIAFRRQEKYYELQKADAPDKPIDFAEREAEIEALNDDIERLKNEIQEIEHVIFGSDASTLQVEIQGQIRATWKEHEDTTKQLRTELNNKLVVLGQIHEQITGKIAEGIQIILERKNAIEKDILDLSVNRKTLKEKRKDADARLKEYRDRLSQLGTSANNARYREWLEQRIEVMLISIEKLEDQILGREISIEELKEKRVEAKRFIEEHRITRDDILGDHRQEVRQVQENYDEKIRSDQIRTEQAVQKLHDKPKSFPRNTIPVTATHRGFLWVAAFVGIFAEVTLMNKFYGATFQVGTFDQETELVSILMLIPFSFIQFLFSFIAKWWLGLLEVRHSAMSMVQPAEAQVDQPPEGQKPKEGLWKRLLRLIRDFTGSRYIYANLSMTCIIGLYLMASIATAVDQSSKDIFKGIFLALALFLLSIAILLATGRVLHQLFRAREHYNRVTKRVKRLNEELSILTGKREDKQGSLHAAKDSALKTPQQLQAAHDAYTALVEFPLLPALNVSGAALSGDGALADGSASTDGTSFNFDSMRDEAISALEAGYAHGERTRCGEIPSYTLDDFKQMNETELHDLRDKRRQFGQTFGGCPDDLLSENAQAAPYTDDH